MEDTLTKQRARSNRIAALGAGVFVHLLVCWTVLSMGFMSISSLEFLALVSVSATGFCVFLLLTLMEWNLTLEDPDMSLPQMLWAVTIVIFTSHFTVEMKPVVVLSGLAMVVIGANRLSRRELMLFAVYSIAMYAVLLAFRMGGDEVEWLAESVTMLAFGLVLVCGPLLYRFEMALIEDTLLDKNEQLNSALRQIRELAVTDELTGAYNRRHLLEVLSQQKALADRGGYTFTICFLDLDFFKRVNDRFGHSTGDHVLRSVAGIAIKILREVDCVARIGGEEFVFVLGGTAEQDALIATHRIAEELKTLQVSANEPGYRITASIGVTEYRRGEASGVTMERADKALYDAKRTGRNKIVVARQDAI